MNFKLFGKSESSKRLDEILKGKHPPTLPVLVMKLLKLLRDPESDLAQIAETLSHDPGLVLRVLKLVNSAAFGRVNTIDSVPHAVTMLGRSQLEQLLLGIAVKGALPRTSVRGFDSQRFWHAAFFRASLAKTLTDRIQPAEKARCFVGALLQDMAVPILVHARAETYGPVLEAWHASPDTPLHELERRALGCSHDELGGHIGVEWDLPDTLLKAITLHHDDHASDRELPAALRLVSLHRETKVQHGIDALVEQGRHMYGLEPDWTRTVVAESDQRASDLSRLLA